VSEPKVSIIVPVYNGEPFLAACLDSLLRQSLCDIEIILVDDGSVDGTDEICRRYATADRRIVHLQQANGGVSCARNTGMRAARGTYLAFSDADDVMLERGIEHMFHTAESGRADLVVAAYLVRGEDGCRFVQPARADCPLELLTSVLNGSNHGALWNKMIRRSSIGAVRFQHDIRYAEDQLFLTELLLSRECALAFEHSPVYVHTVMRTDSATGSGGAALFHLFSSRIRIGGLLLNAHVPSDVLESFGLSASACVPYVVRGVHKDLLGRATKELVSYAETLGKMGLPPVKGGVATCILWASSLPSPIAMALFSAVRIAATAISMLRMTCK
jgi:glycosyltransferase involved in cell wall biosynthesis